MNTTKTARQEAPGRHGRPLLPKLRLLYTGAAGMASTPPRVVPLGDVVVLGREVREADGIALHDGLASRTHATVENRGGGLHLRDRGSKNGTFVNGQRVGETALRDGDLIRAGDSFLLVRHEPLRLPGGAVEGMLGVSAAIAALRHDLGRIGPGQAPVLLLGESGTGKEVAARAVHRSSVRPGEFVAVNCGAIPETLAESLFFGQVAGAFTEARAQPGFFRAAHGGTLFLDEIGDLSLALQPKLLRALESQEVTPVGAVRPVPCDVRLIAATHRDLTRGVQEEIFRGDLYTRLAGIVVRLPPLRERREDVLLLLGHFLGEAPPLTSELVEALLLYAWPYNVRELQRIADELRVRGAGLPRLCLDLVKDRLAAPAAPALGPAAAPGQAGDTPRRLARQRGAPAPTREELLSLLRERSGVVRQVAEVLGCSTRQVGRWMQLYDLDVDSFREA